MYHLSPTIHLSIHPSIHVSKSSINLPFLCLCIDLSIHPCLHVSILICIYLSIHPPIYPFLYPPSSSIIYQSIYPSSIHPSILSRSIYIYPLPPYPLFSVRITRRAQRIHRKVNIFIPPLHNETECLTVFCHRSLIEYKFPSMQNLVTR